MFKKLSKITPFHSSLLEDINNVKFKLEELDILVDFNDKTNIKMFNSIINRLNVIETKLGLRDN